MMLEVGESFGLILFVSVTLFLLRRAGWLVLPYFMYGALAICAFFLTGVSYGVSFSASPNYSPLLKITGASVSRAVDERGGVYRLYRDKNWPAEIVDREKSSTSLILIVLVSILALGILIGLAGKVLFIFMEPPYKVPRIRSLRDQLEEAHPTWYR